METLEEAPSSGDCGAVVVGVDVGGSKIALMATDAESGDELARDRFLTPADVGPDAMIDQLNRAILKLVEQAGRSSDALHAVGVAVPGLVDLRNGRVIVAGNLNGWVDVPLRATLHHQLGIPVWVDQDANAAALGERWRGCATAMDTFVFLALGTGVGAGLFVNGQLHRGRHNGAGEVGNFVMGREYLGRDRGGHGNLERLIGSRSIKQRARDKSGKEIPAGQALADAASDSSLDEIAECVADFLAIAVVNIAALLDPDAIVVGGGTATAGDELLARVRARVAAELARPPALMRSVLGEDAQLYGATFGALQMLKQERNNPS